MSDIIHLLPDSVANQIAAGEVIQRPASVVKELLENSIDAGSTKIQLIVKEAGKSLIQVIDNGKGMSATDARMAFERHATSKISQADDLFAIKTMGFRGEALASIAAVAQVELRTRTQDEEIGTELYISASKVISQEHVQTQAGCSFSIRNLFFNVPARRKFLKTNKTEFKHIVTEFQRVALAYPEIEFKFNHNHEEVYTLPASTAGKRIILLFGKQYQKNLLPVETDTPIVSIKGYVCKPEGAKKTTGDQFFFVNKRFMKHYYFHKAILSAYENILPPDMIPFYFIYFKTDPKSIDINIHPTKTEINFENAPAIFQILRSTIRNALGKFNVTPSIDFDREGDPGIPVFKKDTEVKIPGVEVNPFYNPFDQEKKSGKTRRDKENLKNWETLYNDFEGIATTHKSDVTKSGNSSGEGGNSQRFLSKAGDDDVIENTAIIQIKKRYILTSVKSGLMIIDQKRAHERILFDHFIALISDRKAVTQKSLFPVNIELDAGDSEILMDMIPQLKSIGFDIGEFGKYTFVVNGVPADMKSDDIKSVIESMIEHYREETGDIKSNNEARIALSLAKAASINYGKYLSEKEMRNIIDRLFSSGQPKYTADGKLVIHILSLEELNKIF